MNNFFLELIYIIPKHMIERFALSLWVITQREFFHFLHKSEKNFIKLVQF